MKTIQELLATAWEHYQRGELELTRRTVGEALRCEPLFAEALYLLGVVVLTSRKSGMRSGRFGWPICFSTPTM